MKNAPVHHLHVKYRGDIFTIYHYSDCIELSELYQAIHEIKGFSNAKK